MEVPDPPERTACSACMSPLTWLFSARTQQWVAFVAQPGDNHALFVHTCRPRHDSPRTWRDTPSRFETDPAAVDRVHRGAALARAVLAATDADEGASQ